MIHSRVRTAALCGFVLCCPVFAQPSAAPVVVTAARTPQPLAEVLADMRVIDRETIARAGPLSLAELLQLHGGAEISTNGGPGQVSGVFLRGSNANHVLLLVDGVRVNSATTGTNAFEHIALDQIERIEVLRAPASGLYGADAVGGVIQVFTRQGADGFSARLGAGSWRTRQASARFGASAGATQWSVQGGYRDSQAFSASNPSHAFSFNPDTDPYRQAHGGFNLSHAFSAEHALALRLMRSEGTTHFDSGPGADDLSRQRLSALALESRNRLAPGWNSLLRVARGSDELAIEGSYPSRFRTDQDQLSWQNDIDAAGGRIVAGAEWRQESVSGSTAYTRSERSVRSLFGGYSASAGAHGLQASLRHDDDDQFGASRTGRLAYGWQAQPGWRLSASVGTAFKAPSFNDLYYPLTWGYAGNPALQPERARALELAARYQRPGLRLGLTLFDQRVRDLIAIDSTFSTVVNVNRARIRGSTLSGQWQQGALQAHAEWTLQQPENADNGLQLVRRARRHGSAGLVWTPGPWRLGAEVVASGARFDAASNAAASRMGGYALLNLHAGWQIAPAWSLSARINNAADKPYTLAQGYNTAGRNLFVALAYGGG